MFYGYIEDLKSFNDIVTGLIQGRTGVLDLFVNKNFLSLKVENGLITEFKCDLINEDKKDYNMHNLLIYCLASVLENAQGYFGFYENINFRGFKLESPISGEELMIQATIVRKDMEEILEKIISPYAIFRAVEDKDAKKFEGKNLIEIVGLSEDPVINVLRKVKDFLSEGKLDIYEFRENAVEEESEIEYILEGVPLKKVNVLAILEGIRTKKQSGIVKISSPTYTVNLFFSEGELFGIHPVNFDIFEFLISPDQNAEITIVGMDKTVVKAFALRYLSEPEIKTLSSQFMEISKLFLGLSKYKKDALLLISERRGDRYIVFKNGKVFASLIEEGSRIKHSRDIKFDEPFFISLYLPRKVENIRPIIYTFMLNETMSTLLKYYPSKIMGPVLREAVKMPFLTFEENKFSLVRNISEEEEAQLLGFLEFLLDLSIQELGKEKQEEALEFQLRPFRDIFKVLDIEKYLKTQENV